jgi:ATP-dependent Clp protease adaptor protein ClpS
LAALSGLNALFDPDFSSRGLRRLRALPVNTKPHLNTKVPAPSSRRVFSCPCALVMTAGAGRFESHCGLNRDAALHRMASTNAIATTPEGAPRHYRRGLGSRGLGSIGGFGSRCGWRRHGRCADAICAAAARAGHATRRAQRQRYHGLPLEHANRNTIFHYKIAPVCGILIGNKKTTSPTSMISSVQHMSSVPRHGHDGPPGTPRAADDDRNKRNDPGGPPGTAVITKTRPQVKKPSFYRVLLLNDDYTPMEFVVHVLERFFNKDREAATRIMLHVHHHGIGECGIYTYEVAETKVTQVMDFARKHQHPLQCVMEKK